MANKMNEKAFINHRSNGIYLNFPNGNGVSTIWSTGSYTENHSWKHPSGDIVKTYDQRIAEGSNDVEIMVFCNGMVMELLEAKYPSQASGSGIFGHLKFEEWLDILNILNKHPKS